MECESEHIAEISSKIGYLNGFPAPPIHAEFEELPQVDSGVKKNIANVEINFIEEPNKQSNIPNLLQLFKDVYDQRIKAIENNDNLNRNEKNEEKVAILHQYLQQLQEQNDTFVSTMIELEEEAQQRVKQMEKRLKSSAKTTMEAVINVYECEKEMRRLVHERIYVEALYNDMQQHILDFKVENGFLRDQNSNLNHDVQSLLHIIHHARSTGHWEMDCVTFCVVTPEQVFGPVQSISNVYTSDSPQSDFHLYENEKQVVISDVSSQATDSSASSPYADQSVRIETRDAKSNIPYYRKENHNELLTKDQKIALLEEQLSDLTHQLSVKDAECECLLWKLDVSMQQQKNREDRIRDVHGKLPSYGTTLRKCLSLPDIGNIYSFTNIVRKSYSYDIYGNIHPMRIRIPFKNSANCLKSRQDNKCENHKCQSHTVNRKSQHFSHIRKGQSEPHLFMYDDSIYVYRACEPIKKASNIALHDDYERLPPCQSIDLKFPTDDSNTKYCNWVASNKSGSYTVPHKSYFKDEESSSSCTCSYPEIDNFNREMLTQLFGEKVSSAIQTDKTITYSIGLQAAIKRGDESAEFCSCSDPGVNSFNRKEIDNLLQKEISCQMTERDIYSINLQGNTIEVKYLDNEKEDKIFQMDILQMINTIKCFKENLVKAENKAEAKEMLITQLQSHLTSAIKEVELKDTALSNLEKKLDLSRCQATSLREENCNLSSEIDLMIKDFEGHHVLNKELQLRINELEDEREENLSAQKVLQDQKRFLLTQLDARCDEVESTKQELETAKHRAESCAMQVKQQCEIIRNLQEALVQSKRAFDATQQKIPSSQESFPHFESETKSLSRSSIMDI